MKVKTSDIIICGFALFAIFFGAGNLIFPPYLGVVSGDNWLQAATAFILSDPFFPILGVLVTMALGGRADDLGQRVHPNFAKGLSAIAILLIGPLFSVPRTGATTHEIFIQSFFPGSPQWITSLVFFGITAYIAINPSTVMDAIGKYLTPILLLILAVVSITAIINPPGPLVPSQIDHVFAVGFKEGYQTMDALGAPLMAGIVITDLARRGYTDKKTQQKAGLWAGLLAFVLLALIYGTLTYAGARMSTYFGPGDDRTVIIIEMIDALLGPAGRLAIGVCVALACLTTAVGLTSIFASYFYGLLNKRISYRNLVLLAVLVEFIISLVGVNQIITLAVPILSAIYPITMTLILFSIFDKKITYDATYTGAVIGAGSIGFLQALASFGAMIAVPSIQHFGEITLHLPFASLGLEWIVPSILLAAIFGGVSYYKHGHHSPITTTK
ncbi:MAG: branched-chain amino acid transport system II carrier protein [Aerococcus suis]|nr:branched-chain amino acid transport system II carrier protein [Aerococcus suis]